MKPFDHLSLDGRLLRVFVAVHRAGSVTQAATHLNVTQSTVSHSLNRLRDITGDSLFVAKGRSITPTERADQLVEEAQLILAQMQRFTELPEYVPYQDGAEFNVAANDYEIEVILKPMMRHLRSRAPKVRLNVMRAHSQIEWANLLRSGQVDLVLALPLCGEESDLKQQSITTDRLLCFYDNSQRDAPDDLDKYCDAPHAIMSPGHQRTTQIDVALGHLERTRRIVASLPSFSSVASVIADTDIVALMPSKLRHSIFGDFAFCKFEVVPSEFQIAQIWHVRTDSSARQKWLRQMVSDVCAYKNGSR